MLSRGDLGMPRLRVASICMMFLTSSLLGCKQQKSAELRVGVTPGPVEEILDFVKGDLARQGVALKVIPFTDYIQPDLALSGQDLDANLYQNVPFLNQFNRDHTTHLIALAPIYVPLMAIYPGRTKTLNGLPDHAKISVPNDPVNHGRALLLLERAGLLTLSAGADKRQTESVVNNPHEFQIVELDASQLPRTRQDVDLAVINANFALDAGLDPFHDSVFREQADSQYANVLAVNADHGTDPRVRKVNDTLLSEATQKFIRTHFKGAIVPAAQTP